MRTRLKLRELNKVRLCVYKTSKHMYAQVFSGNGSYVLTSASTLEGSIKKLINYTGNISAAVIVGKVIAQRCIEKSITEVSFDRSGFKFHGRVKALAASARENGLKF